MPRITFVHTSDLQLGMTRWFLGADNQPLFDESRRHAIARLGQLATENDASFIVVAGDVFEHNSLSDRVLLRALESFSALPVPVYLLPGNHDPLVADSIFRRTEGIAGVRVVSSSEPIEVAPGVELVGAPWRTKFPTGDLVYSMLAPLEATDNIRIGLAHGQTESRSNELVPGLIDLDYVESALDDRRLDYLALGDTHSTMSLGRTGKVWFSGTPETTDFVEDDGGGESNSGNALVVTIDKTAETSSVTAVSHPVGKWTFAAIKAELYDRTDIDQFFTRLDGYPDKARTVIKYALQGTLSLSDTQVLTEGLATRAPVFAALYERTRLMDLHLEPGEEEIEALTLGGVAAGALHELMGDTEDDVARDAVNLMFRLSQEVSK